MLFGSLKDKNWGLGGSLQSLISTEILQPPDEPQGLSGGCLLTADYYDFYRTAGMEGRGASFQRSLLCRSYITGNSLVFTWRLGLSGIDRLSGISVEPQALQDIRLGDHSRRTVVDASLRRGFFNISGSTEVSTGTPPNREIVATLSHNKYVVAYFEYKRAPFESQLLAHWFAQEINLNITSLTENIGAAFQTPGWHLFNVQFALNRTTCLHYNPAPIHTAIEPDGEITTWRAQLNCEFNRYRFTAGTRGLQSRLTGYGTKSDLPYAKLTRIDGDVWTLFGSLCRNTSGRMDIFEMEYLYWTGYGRGHIEFWPFTPGWIALLGQRRYFIAETQGNILRLHIGSSRQVADHWFLAAGLNLLDIRPDLTLNHWKPSYLIFGKADERFESLSLYRSLVGVLSFSASYRRPDWNLEYSLMQGFPIKTWRRGVTQPTEPAIKPAPVYGAGFHRIQLSATLPR